MKSFLLWNRLLFALSLHNDQRFISHSPLALNCWPLRREWEAKSFLLTSGICLPRSIKLANRSYCTCLTYLCTSVLEYNPDFIGIVVLWTLWVMTARVAILDVISITVRAYTAVKWTSKWKIAKRKQKHSEGAHRPVNVSQWLGYIAIETTKQGPLLFPRNCGFKKGIETTLPIKGLDNKSDRAKERTRFGWGHPKSHSASREGHKVLEGYKW